MKGNKVLSLAFLGLLLLTVIGFSLTAARYQTTKQSSGLTGELEYTIVNRIEIDTTEEFFSAIANGYSNIRLSDNMTNPMLVSGDAMNITSDLILDLNGHDIQRNSREPMLNIVSGVKMTVVDSSAKENGSFYNPVGSVLNINGGILTVLSGTFESGARANEYYSNLGTEMYQGGIIDRNADLTLHRKNGSTEEGVSLPILLPTRVNGMDGSGNSIFKYNGNIYFDSGYSTAINSDTYLYFVLEGSSDTIVASTGDADFSYEYYVTVSDAADTVDGNNATYRSFEYAQVQARDDGTEATKGNLLVKIYGYEKVKQIAKNEDQSYMEDTGEQSDFAAIKMQSGSLYSRGGSYTSHFGVGSAYCIYASGGRLTVSSGKFEAKEEGVCIRAAFGDTLSEGSLSVTDGLFKSYKGDTIQVRSGDMTVTGGRFIKDARAYSIDAGGSPVELPADANRAVIRMEVPGGAAYEQGGPAYGITPPPSNLFLLGTDRAKQFEIYGSGITAVDASLGANVVAEKATFVYNSNIPEVNNAYYDQDVKSGDVIYNHNIAIRCNGGYVTTDDCIFDIPDDDSLGIDLPSTGKKGAENVANIDVQGTIFVISGRESTAVKMLSGNLKIGDDAASQEGACIFYIDHVKNCYGIYTEDSGKDEMHITLNAAQFIMGAYYEKELVDSVVPVNDTPMAYRSTSQEEAVANKYAVFNSAGIMLNIAENDTFKVQRALFLTSGSYTAGIHAKTGSIIQKGAPGANRTMVIISGVKHKGYLGEGRVSPEYEENAEALGNGYFAILRQLGETPYPFFYITENSQSGWSYTALDHSNFFDTHRVQGKDTYKAKELSEIPKTNFANELNITNAKGSYGIFSNGADLTFEKLYVNLTSTYSAAIRTQDSLITIDDFQCDLLTSGNYIQGELDSSLNNNRLPGDNTTYYRNLSNLYPGDQSNTKYADINATVIQLNHSANATEDDIGVRIKTSKVNTDAYGYKVDGKLYLGTTVSGGENESNSMASLRATAITVNGDSASRGLVNFGAHSTFTLYSNIGDKIHNTGHTTHNNQTELVDYATTNWNDPMRIKSHGVYVDGGELVAKGKCNLYFSGITNDVTYDNYDAFNAHSYAVYVTGMQSNVDILNAEIVSTVGGGVYAGYMTDVKSERPIVRLGAALDTENVHITTLNNGLTAEQFDRNGDGAYGDIITKYNNEGGGYSNLTEDWRGRLPVYGGSAVYSQNGVVIVNGGDYSSAMGSGVLVSGKISEVTVEDGTFVGTDAYQIEVTNDQSSTGKSWTSAFTGPIASAGLKLLDGTVTVNGGFFHGLETSYTNPYNGNVETHYSGNGILIKGDISTFNNTTKEYNCIANLNGGEVISHNGRGVVIMEFAQVNIGTPDGRSAFSVVGNIYGVGLEQVRNGYADPYIDVNIYGGDFTGGNWELSNWAWQPFYIPNPKPTHITCDVMGNAVYGVGHATAYNASNRPPEGIPATQFTYRDWVNTSISANNSAQSTLSIRQKEQQP